MAEDLLSVVDQLDLDPALAVGHSMGASILLAEQIRPTFKAAWLFEPIVISPTTLLRRIQRVGLLGFCKKKKRDIYISRRSIRTVCLKTAFSSVDSDALWAYVNYGFSDHEEGVILKCRGEIEAQVFESSVTTIYDNLATVETLVTVAAGGDKEGPAQIAPIVANELPNGQFRFLRNTLTLPQWKTRISLLLKSEMN